MSVDPVATRASERPTERRDGPRDEAHASARVEPAVPAVPLSRVRIVRMGVRTVVGVLLALYLFTIALKLLSASAGGVADLLGRVSAEGPLNLLGFGWLLAYGALSGSPVAALSLSLLDGGATTARESLAMVAGSRFGASLIVLVVGFVAYMRGRRRPDGIYIGVISLLTTATIYAPATVLALLLLDSGWLDGASNVLPSGWGDAVDTVTNPVMDPAREHLAGIILFVLGVGALLLAFSVFDRLLPNLDPPSPGVERLSRRLSSVRAMFILGALITSVTMSVAISLTILVPLTLKGIVRRETVIPYVMGANITTFLDTLFASLLLRSEHATPVVLAEMLGVTIVSVLVLLLAYGPYSRMVLGIAHRAASSRRGLATFLAVFGIVPVALLLV